MPFWGVSVSPSCITIDYRLIKERRIALYLTLVWAEVPHPKLETYAIQLAGFAKGDRGPVSFLAWQALMESVDYWPMAIIIHKTLEGKPKPVAVSRRDWWKVSLS
jgi:hypothetical protein